MASSKERKDFFVIIASIALVAAITIFLMIQFWWLPLRLVGVIMLLSSLICFAPVIFKVKYFGRIKQLLVIIGIISIVTAFFVIVPSY